MSHQNPYYGAYANQQAPVPGTVAAQPSLSPPGLADFASGQWGHVPAYLPTLLMPRGSNTGLTERDYGASFTFTAASAQTTTISFQQPTTVYAITAAAFDTNAAAFPVGLNPLDTFRFQSQRTNGDLFQTVSVLGSTVCGTAAQPRLVGPSGWMFDTGASIRITITPRVANLGVDLVLWAVEVRGPFNFTWKAIPFGYVG